MKKLYLFFAFTILLPNTALFAQKSSATVNASTDEIADRIDVLLEDGVVKNNREIFELSASLPQEKRNELYDKHKQNSLKTCLLNITPFGLGSFMAQDTAGGVIQLVTDAAGWGAIIGGSYLLSHSEYVDYEKEKTTYSGNETKYYYDIHVGPEAFMGLGLIVTGAFSVIGSHAFGAIRPWSQTKKHNHMIRSVLRANDDKSSKKSVALSDTTDLPALEERNELFVDFAPVINPIEQQYGIVAKIQL